MKTIEALDLLQFDALVFDLDGTLWDASNATSTGWNKVAKNFNLDLSFSSKDIKSVSGLPFDECVNVLFKELPTVSDFKDQLDQAEKAEIHQNGGNLYPGVKDGLKELRKHFKLFLVSNCQDWYLRAFLKHSGLHDLFTDTICLGSTGLSKTENIRHLIIKYKLKKPVYIGDTHWDQESSSKAGVSFIFAKYGFGNITSNKCMTIESFNDLVDCLN